MILPILCTPPGDDVSSTLAADFLHASQRTMAVQPGDIARFGSPTPSSPIRVRLVRQSQLSGGVWSISDPTKAATYRATGVSGQTLTGVAFESGTAQDFSAGDLVAVTVTARDFTDIHARLDGGQINILQFGTVIGDGVSDDHAAIQAIHDAHPGRIIYYPTTVVGDPFALGYLHASYHLSAPIDLHLQAGGGIVGDGASTLLAFGPGSTGIILGPGQLVRDVSLQGSEPWTGGHDYFNGVIPAVRYPGVTKALGASDADGIRITGAGARIENVAAFDFGRDGINGSAPDLNLPLGTGAEDTQIDKTNCFNNRGNGITIEGGDSNCCLLNTVNVNVNQFWALKFAPFLAGAVTSPQADQNGADGSWSIVGDEVVAGTIGSLARSGNLVTLVWSAQPGNGSGPSSPIAVGDGVWIQTCTDASFLGRWRVLMVSSDHLTVTYAQVAANAIVAGGSAGTGKRCFLPQDGTIASAARAGNIVTLTFSAPYAIAGGTGGFAVGQGITLVNCPDASFHGTFVVRSVAVDRRSLTFWASTPGSVAGIRRSGGVATLTYLGQYRTTPKDRLGFAAGSTSVTVAGCPDASFNGTFAVSGVADITAAFAAVGIPTVLTYAQAGADAGVGPYAVDQVTASLTIPDATITSGTARMAAPQDLWDACGLLGGSYYAPVATGRCVWINPYAEGGQRSRFSQANLIFNPVWSQQPDNTPEWTATPCMFNAQGDLPFYNKPVSTYWPYDGPVASYQSVGLTANAQHVHTIQDALDGSAIFREIRSAAQWALQYKDPLRTIASVRMINADPAEGSICLNSLQGATFVGVNLHEGGTGGLAVGVGTGGNPITRVYGGQITMVPIADAAALNGALFLGSDHAGHPCWKDASGVVHTFNMTP